MIIKENNPRTINVNLLICKLLNMLLDLGN